MLEYKECGNCLKIDRNRTCLHPLSIGYKRFVTPAECDICPVRCLTTEKPPPFKVRAIILIRSLWRFVCDGMKFVSRREKQRRLEICAGCEFKVRNTCVKCGCNLSYKASMRSMDCPERKW